MYNLELFKSYYNFYAKIGKICYIHMADWYNFVLKTIKKRVLKNTFVGFILTLRHFCKKR